MRPNIVPFLGNHEYAALTCLPWLMEELTGVVRRGRVAVDQVLVREIGFSWLGPGQDQLVQLVVVQGLIIFYSGPIDKPPWVCYNTTCQVFQDVQHVLPGLRGEPAEFCNRCLPAVGYPALTGARTG